MVEKWAKMDEMGEKMSENERRRAKMGENG
jgi:hypothetical protein